MTTSETLAPELATYLDARAAELDSLPAERRALLDDLADELARRERAGEPLRVLFVCTHNSRRSQLAQLWAWAAGAREGLALETHSGGTEATAFNPRAVAAARRAGFAIDAEEAYTNPHYRVSLGATGTVQDCYSKTFDDAIPAGEPFVAVMVCGEADAACPNVPGADHRIAITYRDPKESDGTPAEAATYDERCAQIAREMLYVVRRARAQAG